MKNKLCALLTAALGIFAAQAQTPVTMSAVGVTGQAVDTTITFTAMSLLGQSYPNVVLGTTGIPVATTNGIAATNLLEGPYQVSFRGVTKTLHVFVPGTWVTNSGYTLPVNLAEARWQIQPNYNVTITMPATATNLTGEATNQVLALAATVAGGGGTAVAAGTNTVTVTNGASVSVNVPSATLTNVALAVYALNPSNYLASVSSNNFTGRLNGGQVDVLPITVLSNRPAPSADEIIAAGLNIVTNEQLTVILGQNSTETNTFSGGLVVTGNRQRTPTSSADGLYATALGSGTTASGTADTALGANTIASGGNSLAVGEQTTASGSRSFAGGYFSEATGQASVALGESGHATNNNAFVWSSGTPTYSPSNGSFTVSAPGGVWFRDGVVNGTFTGDGSGLTQPSNVVTNIILRPDGTNDSSVLWQAAFDTSNSIVLIYPGDYYATNLWGRVPGVTVYGWNATLHQLPADSQNFFATNVDADIVGNGKTNLNAIINISAPGFTLIGLTVDGLKPAYYARTPGTNDPTFALYTSPSSGLYPEAVPFALYGQNTNNYGIVYDAGYGGGVMHCRALNFGYAGFVVQNHYGALAQYRQMGEFYGNEAISNYVGFSFRAISPTSTSTCGNAEYLDTYGLKATLNTFGFAGAPSNLNLHDSQGSGNYCAMAMAGRVNPNGGPHTRVTNLKLNHNYCGFFLGAGDALWLDNIYEAATMTNFIVATPNVYFSACDLAPIFIFTQYSDRETNAIRFQNSRIGGIVANTARLEFNGNRIYSRITVTNSVVADMRNNLAVFAYTNWDVNVITNLGNSAVQSAFNAGTFGTNGMSFTGTLSGDGSGLTNLNAANLVGVLPMGSFAIGSTNNASSLSMYVTDGTNRWTTRDGSGLTNLNLTNAVLTGATIASSIKSTGSSLQIGEGNSIKWQFYAGGLQVVTDNTGSIGASSGRPKSLFIGTGNSYISGPISCTNALIIPYTTPASSGETNYVGAIAGDGSYLYFWTATNVNKRVALSAW